MPPTQTPTPVCEQEKDAMSPPTEVIPTPRTEITTTPSFIWKPSPKKAAANHKEPEGIRGYHIVHLHFRLLYALHLHDLPQSRHWSAFIAILPYRRGQWTHAEAISHMVNETMLSMRSKIIL